MNAHEEARAARLGTLLDAYATEVQPLPGISDPAARDVLLRQLIDSLRRVEYPQQLLQRPMSARRVEPADELFDPIRGAAHFRSQGQYDEACWLVFLSVMYGKSKRLGWRVIGDVYGRLGQGGWWDWASVSAHPRAFAQWIVGYSETLSPRGGPRVFGNHRKYESFPSSGRTAETYVAWVGADGHAAQFAAASESAGGDRRLAFHTLYRSMSGVYRFGRLARFDYLTMLGKLDLAEIEPGSTYMSGATGPVKGARLLFTGNANAGAANAGWTPQRLDRQLAEMDECLGVGMQVLEDALCNWQKSPTSFRHFRG